MIDQNKLFLKTPGNTLSLEALTTSILADRNSYLHSTQVTKP